MPVKAGGKQASSQSALIQNQQTQFLEPQDCGLKNLFGGDLVARGTISSPPGFSHLGSSHCARQGGERHLRGALGPSPHPGRLQGEGTGCALAAGPQLSASLSVPAPAGQLGPDATPHPMTQQKVKPEPAPAGWDPVLAVSPSQGVGGELMPRPGTGWPVQGIPLQAKGAAVPPAHPRASGAHCLLSRALFVNHHSCSVESH